MKKGKHLRKQIIRPNKKEMAIKYIWQTSTFFAEFSTRKQYFLSKQKLPRKLLKIVAGYQYANSKNNQIE